MMFRSGKFPKVISRYVSSLGKKVEAEILLNTVKFINFKTKEVEKRVSSLEAVGVADISDPVYVNNLLAIWTNKDGNTMRTLENGLIVTDVFLEQRVSGESILKIGFTVDYHKMAEWSVLEFQETPAN